MPLPCLTDLRIWITGVHIGKILVHTSGAGAKGPVTRATQLMDMPDSGYAPDEQPVKGALDDVLHVRGQFWARKDRSYVITGGLGGFGLALAVWLARRGAGHIVLSSKRCRFLLDPSSLVPRPHHTTFPVASSQRVALQSC